MSALGRELAQALLCGSVLTCGTVFRKWPTSGCLQGVI